MNIFKNKTMKRFLVCKKCFFVLFKLLLVPWDLSHRVEHQRLIIISCEEMSERVPKGGFMVNLLLLTI